MLRCRLVSFAKPLDSVVNYLGALTGLNCGYLGLLQVAEQDFSLLALGGTARISIVRYVSSAGCPPVDLKFIKSVPICCTLVVISSRHAFKVSAVRRQA